MKLNLSARSFDENLETFELMVHAPIQKRGKRKPFIGKPWTTWFTYKLRYSMLQDPESFMSHIRDGAYKAIRGDVNGLLVDFDYDTLVKEIEHTRECYRKYHKEQKEWKEEEVRIRKVHAELREKYKDQDLPVLKVQVGENEYSYCGEELEKFDRGEQFMSESKLVNRGRCFETGRYKIYKNKQKDFDTSKFPKGNCNNWMELERGTDEWGDWIITKADFDSGD